MISLNAKKKSIGKERLKVKTHEELNSLKDTLNKALMPARQIEAWLARTKPPEVKPKKKKRSNKSQCTFEQPVDSHVVYTSDIFWYDSVRSALALARDIVLITARLALHPVREIRNTRDICDHSKNGCFVLFFHIPGHSMMVFWPTISLMNTSLCHQYRE